MSTLVVLAALLFGTVATACGGDSMPAVPKPTIAAVLEASPTPSVTPVADQAIQPSLSEVVSARPAVSASTDVVTEEDLLNTTHPLEGTLAPELIGLESWIGSEPVTIASLQGQIILIDFWTYSCINCIRTLPFILEWQEKYEPLGLRIIGVHTPEFDFEKDAENVRAAVDRFGIDYPVALDNDAETWDAFGVTAWPAKYLIDAEGVIRYAEVGEGGYVAMEQTIRHWFRQAGIDVSSVPFKPEDYHLDPEIDRAGRVGDRELARTREIYAGYRKNLPFHRFPPPRPWVLYEEFYEGLDTDVAFEDVPEHENQRLYIQGLWHVGPESLAHARATEGFEDYLAIKFNAKTVNAVLGHDGGDPYRVRITLDGKPLSPDDADTDVQFDNLGNSYLDVDESRMYRLIRTVEFEQHELQLSSNSDRFELFTFTFGAYENLEDN
ncbi:MAG: redoxin domain-containing protein [Chloroflexi bacterium]|nr:redoxin domain-containing protein [Chloroflexota bacterium]